MPSSEDKFVFHVEWFDQQADVIRRYLMSFFPSDSSISMFDVKNNRPFLKRSEYADITMANIYVGATITVLARQLKIIDYGDEYTRKILTDQKGRTLAMIKPDAYNNIGQILDAVGKSGLIIGKLKMIRMDASSAAEFCCGQDPEGLGPEDASHLSTDVCVVMELIGKDAVAIWQQMMGPKSAAQAKAQAPKSIRGALAADDVRNAVHGSSSNGTASQELDFFFR